MQQLFGAGLGAGGQAELLLRREARQGSVHGTGNGETINA